MNLSETEYYEFLDANQSLILYAGKRKKIVDAKWNLEEFRTNCNGKLALECANAFYDNPHILREFAKENPDKLSDEKIKIAEDFRYFEKGSFFVYKYLKDYTVFIKDDLAFGVLSLSDPFEAFFGNNLPTYVETVLLPFKGKIVYHGLLMGGRMRFGSGYRKSLNEVYKKAKAKYGIITSLPFSGNAVYAKESPADQLKYFMKTKANRAEFETDIQQLLKKHEDLTPLYYQEWGRIDASYYRKEFKKLGLNKAYYALLQGQIIGSAFKQKDLDNLIQKLVPASKRAWVYTFKM